VVVVIVVVVVVVVVVVTAVIEWCRHTAFIHLKDGVFNLFLLKIGCHLVLAIKQEGIEKSLVSGKTDVWQV
jgi:hypothetical protein